MQSHHDTTDSHIASHGHNGHGGHDHGDHDHGGHAHDDHGHDHHGGGFLSRLKSIFVPHSHDHIDSIDSVMESTDQGIRAVKISLVGLMITAVLQVFIVVLSGSVALLADTIHNFSDALTSIPLWIAFLFVRRAATSRYTYGYRRAEDLAGLFVVAMIALSAIVAGWESIRRLLNPESLDHIPWVIAAGVIGFIGNEIVAVYRITVGRRIGSSALVADGYHARTDGFTSLGVVASGIGAAMGFERADPIVGLIITAAILVVLFGAGKSVFQRLMDGVEPSLVTTAEASASEVDGVVDVSDIRIRWTGHRLDAALTVSVHPDLTVVDGHDVAQRVRHALHHSLPNLDRAMVHVDPIDEDGRHHELTSHHAL
ncbi:Cobalt-zinc-cadmium resistance protein CzcD [Euzebya pacifica]|uniref:Cobalt-zinc-cadmium resistance protein CzcD n=1 Tax=Euzebya pacifica TaxID=1608957 RepID=A0A346Y168_9ACTN|nr:cation diffusion facilitator family transporter [Euzebya pacifica]AXV08215.1 Cobalt-zinc-cadmium resistance protein CzcD [Euzebya pacifica]